MTVLWILQLGLVLGCLLMAEVAFRIGRARRRVIDEPMKAQITTVQAATLGLLALFLGFTLAMAESRFTGRRQIIVDEANAIGTTYLRTQLLPEPQRGAIRALLREYVDARRDFYAAADDVEHIRATTAHAEKLHGEIWARAMEVGQVHPDWAVMVAYLTALNEMIDLEATRLTSLHTRLPATIIALLVFLTLAGVGVTGFSGGLAGERTALSVYVVPILVGVACATVIDLDAPRVGLIRTGDFAMEHLQQGISADEPQASTP